MRNECKHHWMCETTIEGITPARCKLCGEERVFRAKELSWVEAAPKARKRPTIVPSQLGLAQMPFNPSRYEPRRAGWKGYRL